MSLIKVAIVDDDEGIRGSLSALINRATGFKLVGEFANAEIALKEIPQLAPDVVLMDINLPGMKGYECVRQIKASHPAVQFLMLTVYEDGDSLFNSLRAGASGYLLKRTASARLLEAIRDVYNGGAPMTPQLARRVVQFFSKPAAESTPWPSSPRPSANSWTNSPMVTLTRRSPTGCTSVLTPCGVTCGRFMKNCTSIPGRRRWSNTCAADRMNMPCRPRT